METSSYISLIENKVRGLIEDLKTNSIDTQRDATGELWELACQEKKMENHFLIVSCGAIKPLVKMLLSPDLEIQKNAVSALLNLGITPDYTIVMAKEGIIEPLIHLLKTSSPEVKEKSALILANISMFEEYKIKNDQLVVVINQLVELLSYAVAIGKQDVSTTLIGVWAYCETMCWLSRYPENKLSILQAGAVKPLVDLMDSTTITLVFNSAVKILSNLATTPNGQTEIGHSGGIPVLVKGLMKFGSTADQYEVVATLLKICTNCNLFCAIALQDGIVQPLVALSQSGDSLTKEKVNN